MKGLYSVWRVWPLDAVEDVKLARFQSANHNNASLVAQRIGLCFLGYDETRGTLKLEGHLQSSCSLGRFSRS